MRNEKEKAGREHLSPGPPLRFSVAMCTYNGALYLREQLDSLSGQTQLPAELVVSDDASTDDTFSLLEGFAETAPFPVRLWRNEKNLGYSRNFAQTILRCSCELVALSDQDDFWHPDKLAVLTKHFLADQSVQGIFSNGELMDTQSRRMPGDLWGSFAFTHADQVQMETGEAVSVLLQRNVVTGMAFAFRASWANYMRTLPASWPHDAWLALMIAMEGKLSPLPEQLVTYRVHTEQQVGVPITRAQKRAFVRKNGFGAYLALSLERNVREYRKDAIQYGDLLAPLQQGTALQRQWLPEATAKAAHLREAYERLSKKRIPRAPGVLRHWRDYQRYSPTGLKALVRDLFLNADDHLPALRGQG